jgi:hypothetical protein
LTEAAFSPSFTPKEQARAEVQSLRVGFPQLAVKGYFQTS